MRRFRWLAVSLMATMLAAGCSAAQVAAPVGSRPAASATTGSTGTALANSSTASCVEGYSLETLAHRAFAFDGTIVRIGPATTNRAGATTIPLVAATFDVNRWFDGGR